MRTFKTIFVIYLSLLALAPGRADTGQPLAPISERIQLHTQTISTTRFPATVPGRRPAAILLHGYQCLEACSEDYARYARSLAAAGIDAYVVNYYNESDLAALKAGTLDAAGYAGRFKRWALAVRELMARIGAQNQSNGRIAVVGFSQGGRLAVAVAADNPAATALVALYARLPDPVELDADLKALPPTLLLHGDADTVVPLRGGEAILAKARELVTPSDLVIYPGEGHGFDFSADSAAAIDARRRVVEFLRSALATR